MSDTDRDELARRRMDEQCKQPRDVQNLLDDYTAGWDACAEHTGADPCPTHGTDPVYVCPDCTPPPPEDTRDLTPGEQKALKSALRRSVTIIPKDPSEPPPGYRLSEVTSTADAGRVFVGKACVQTGGTKKQAVAACWAHYNAHPAVAERDDLRERLAAALAAVEQTKKNAHSVVVSLVKPIENEANKMRAERDDLRTERDKWKAEAQMMHANEDEMGEDCDRLRRDAVAQLERVTREREEQVNIADGLRSVLEIANDTANAAIAERDNLRERLARAEGERDEAQELASKVSDAFGIVAGSIHLGHTERMTALARALRLSGLVLANREGGGE